MATSGDDLNLVKLLGSISSALAIIAGTITAGWMRTRKELSKLRKEESSDQLDIKRDRVEAASLESMQRVALEWESQYHKAMVRETRARRLLAVADGKLRKFVQQAAEDRMQDRLKIEAMVALLAEKDRRIVELEAQLGGRRPTDHA